MFKKFIVGFLFIFIVVCTHAQDATGDIVADTTSDKIVKKESKPLTKEQEMKNEISILKQSLSLDIKNLGVTEKEIIKVTDKLLFENKKEPVTDEEKVELANNRSNLLMQKVNLTQTITEKKILITSKSSLLNRKKDNFVQAEGTLNWQKTFDLKGKSGKWHISAVSKDNMENYSQIEAVNIDIDPKSDIPTLTVINPQPYARVPGDLFIVGTAFDDDGVDRVEMYIKNSESDEFRKVEGRDFWNYSLNTSEMQDGLHNLRFKVYDINGKVSRFKGKFGAESEDLVVPFILDRKVPVVSVTSLKSGQIVSGNIVLEGSASDFNGIKSVQYSTDNRQTYNNMKIKFKNNEKSEVDFSAKFNSNIMVDGVQTIWVKALDNAGSEGFFPITLTIDHKLPELEITYPKDGDTVSGVFKSFVFARDNVDVTKVVVELKGADEKLVEIKTTVGFPFWKFDIDTRKVKSGNYNLVASAYDIAGNISTKSIKLTIDQIKDKPVLTLESFNNNDIFSNVLPVFGTIVDNNSTKEVQYKVYSQNKTVVSEGVINSKYNFSKMIDLRNKESFPDGKYVLELIPSDINDTKGDAVNISFFIDTQYPSFNAESILKWAGRSFGKLIDMPVVIEKAGDLKSVTYSIENRSGAEILKETELKFRAQQGTPNFVCDNIKVDFIQSKLQYEDGLTLIKLKATDRAGKTSRLIVPFFIDTKSPVITSPVIPAKSFMNKDETFSVTDNLLIREIKYSITSNSKEVAPITAVLQSDEDIIPLKTKGSDGKLIEYTAVVEASDMGGNVSRSSVKLAFEPSAEPEYNLLINAVRNTRDVYSEVPIFFSGESFNLDELNGKSFVFLPGKYTEEYELSYRNGTTKLDMVNIENGVYFLSIDNETRAAIGSGVFKADIIDISDKTKTTILTTMINNDFNIPGVKVIYPPAKVSFNSDFTLYGSISDDSKDIKVSFVDFSKLPLSIPAAEFETEQYLQLPQNVKNELLKYYIKDKSNIYQLTKIPSSLLKDVAQLFVQAGLLNFVDIMAEQNNNVKPYSVPLIDALKRMTTEPLENFIKSSDIILNPTDRLFRLNVNTEALSDGEIRFVFKVSDNAGKNTFIPYSYIIDKTPPEITVDRIIYELPGTTPETPEESVSGAVSLKGNAKDNLRLSEVVYIHNDTILEANNRELFDFNYNLRNLKGVNLKTNQNIPHIIKMFAIDSAGNRTNIEKQVIIDPKSDIPELYINSPSIPGQRFTTEVELGGVATDTDGVDHIRYRLSKVSGAQGEWGKIEITQGMNWNHKMQASAGMSGKYILEVQAVDIYGTQSDIQSIDFHIDLENPEIIVSSPASASYLQKTQRITGRVIDPNGIKSVEISTNNGWSFTNTEGSGGSWWYTFNSASVPDGELKVFIKAKDEAGSESFSFALFNIDNTEPELDILLPKDGSVIYGKYNLVGRAKDNIAIDHVKLWSNGDIPGVKDREGFVTIKKAVGKSSLETFEYIIDTTSWANKADFDPNKQYNLVIRAVDKAGNMTDRSISFKINPKQAFPVVEIDQPQPNQVMTGEVIEFFGTAYHDDGIESVAISINGEKEIIAEGTNKWSLKVPAVNMPEKIHSISVIALKKSAGTEKTIGSASTIFIYRGDGPIITVTSHINGYPMEHRPWLTGTASFYEKDIEFKIKRKIQEKKYSQLENKFRRTPELIPKVDEIEVSKFELESELSKYRNENVVSELLLSLDNGKTYEKASIVSGKWKVRVQTQNLSNGVHMLQMRARTRSNKEQIKHFKIFIDRERPDVLIDIPVDNAKVNETVFVRGASNDNGTIEEVKVSLNRFDKDLGKMPKFIQGIYLWSQYDFDFLGGSGMLITGGIGMSFFDDIVRLEGVFGWRPSRDNMNDLIPGVVTNPSLYPGVGIKNDDPLRDSGYYPYPEEGYNPRFKGFVAGGKLLARILDIPFEPYLGEDARNFSISLEIGAAFLWYSGFGGSSAEVNKLNNNLEGAYDASKDGKLLSGFLYQFDFFKVEKYGILQNFAIYLENAFFFIPAEVNAGIIMHVGLGVRTSLYNLSKTEAPGGAKRK